MLLNIHSSLFKEIETSTILLPTQLEPTALTSIVDYLHGFQLQNPPVGSIEDFYAAACYFRLEELKRRIKSVYLNGWEKKPKGATS